MARQVYAHYMVGLTDQQTLTHWKKDISDAKAASIDGFALNIGPKDSWTRTQLDLAYKAAAAAKFKLFLSFDMQDGPNGQWDVSQVVELVNDYKNDAAQVKVNGKPMVQTFEGHAWSSNWASVRSQTGGIFLVPNWSSLGPNGLADYLNDIDGAFSWDAWPRANTGKMASTDDVLYQNVLGDKPYMMGVSPYFYVNLPNWGKNWYSSSESLWYDRWQQVLEIMPEYIEIITWNDYSESSYIADISTPQIVSGAEKYVSGFSHKAFRAVLPYFIRAYKAGTWNVDLHDTAIAWYRGTSANLGSDGGTVWGQGGSQSAKAGARDVVSVITVTTDEAEVNIAIGDVHKSFMANGTASRVNYFEMPFGGALGNVSLSLNGHSVTGPAITNTLPATGYVNFNSYAIRL
ncbi:glycoside hydrolase family 71 protein [Mariannaea sp. PMI_226]|nr:glycoside hydrolase family 71 protein [Mariannaea sp. PMI_226]